MKKIFGRSVCLLLAASMTVPMLAGCAKDNKENSASGTGSTSGEGSGIISASVTYMMNSPALPVLAAVAIPAIVGITNSANESQDFADAATIDNSCKTYYAGIVAGSINSDNFSESCDYLPGPGATNSEKKEAANHATIEGALRYNGLWSIMEGKLDKFGADKDGNIISKNGSGRSGVIDTDNYFHETLRGSTNLGDLYNFS